MSAHTDLTVRLVDDNDGDDATIIVSRRDVDGPDVVEVSGDTVFVTLASLEDFAYRLLGFVEHHRTDDADDAEDADS